MLLSQLHGLQLGPADDWFDPILERDTRLFVDPFLVFKEDRGFWAPAHGELIAHFNLCFRLIAEGNRNPESLAYRKALDLLAFTEPSELCLGYTQEGTRGAGSGTGFAHIIADAIVAAINRGLTDLRHFEELGILGEGIGADRISDIACTILKPRLIEYTKEITARHDIPTRPSEVRRGALDAQRLRWSDPSVALPVNPQTEGPLLFVPARFLARLPQLNASDWWDDYQNERLRTDVNYEVMRRVDKATIVRTAREHPDAVRRWVISQEQEPARPYDLQRDSAGQYQWHFAAQEFVADNPLRIAPAATPEQFSGVIELVVARFRLFVEQQGGWRLLWDLRHEKPEDAAQLLFYGIARNYCDANNIVIDREVDFGRGPVDFKFSNGLTFRAHLEVKKLHNTRFWDGLDAQLPSYLQSDDVRDAWFVAVRYHSSSTDATRASLLPERTRRAAAQYGRNIRGVLIDARPRESASRLRGTTEDGPDQA